MAPPLVEAESFFYNNWYQELGLKFWKLGSYCLKVSPVRLLKKKQLIVFLLPVNRHKEEKKRSLFIQFVGKNRFVQVFVTKEASKGLFGFQKKKIKGCLGFRVKKIQDLSRSWRSIEHQGSFLKGFNYRGFATRCRNIQDSWIFELSRLSTLDDGDQVDIEKFDGKNDFALWQVRMKALLEQQGLAAASEELPAATIAAYDNVIQKKSLQHTDLSQSEYIDEFHKLVGDLAAIDTAISDEDQAFLLLTSLPSSYDNFVETFLYGRDTLKLEDVLATLNSRELQKMMKAKGDGGKGLYVRRRSGQRDMEYNHMKSQGCVRIEDHVFDMEYDGGNILLGGDGRECRVRGMELSRNLISLGTLKKEGFSVKMQSGKIKAVTKKRLKGMKRLGGYQTSGWFIDGSPSSAIGFKMPIDMLGFFGWLDSIKQGMLELVKVKCIFLGYRKGIVGNKILRLDDITSKLEQSSTCYQSAHRNFVEVKPDQRALLLFIRAW
ncbi:hypothetical protein Tco_1102370 [Tanacetum coccineum]